MALSPGSSLGPYRIAGALGAGGMGEVYRAHDPRLGRDVALKVLPADMASEPARLERFTREARAIAALSHPHIVTIYSTEEANGIRFLTMELVEGQPLDDLIPPTGLPVARFLELALPLADALTAAHAKQITHRDLKPANVMVAGDGRVKVLDFGLARVGGPLATHQTIEATRAVLTSEGTIVGTMPYMSPEQIEGRTLDHRTDLFSLGVMFHEMLTGSRPFTGESSPQLMSSILRDVPVSASDVRPDVPDALSRLIHRCLEKRPDDRVQTARDIYNELKHVQKQLESTATRRPDSASRTHVPAVAGSLWIAVLPFSLRGADADGDALASGLTEDVTAGLARFSGLSVVALQSARSFKDSTLDVRQIAERLTARYILSGSVRAAASGYRVAAHLIDAHSGAQLWTGTYDRTRAESDIFALQDDLTDRIVATVADKSGVLARSLAQAARGIPLEQLSATQLVHRSWGFQIRPAPDEHADLRAALEAFVRSNSEEPAIWAALAQVYVVEHSLGFNPLPDALGRAFRAARRAVEIDPSHQRGWAELAFICLFLRDETGLRDASARALALNPRDANAVAYVGNVLTHIGDYDRGCDLTERAMSLNPSHAGWLWFAPFNRHFSRGEFEQALHAARRVNIPDLHWMHICTAAAAGHLGLAADGGAALQSLAAVAPALVDEVNLQELFARWYWDEAFVERLLEGVARSRALAASGGVAASPGTASSAPKSAITAESSPATSLPSAKVPREPPLERRNRRVEPRGLQSRPATALSTRIAVLPFTAPAGDADAAALAGSLTEDVATGLARFSYLSVVPSHLVESIKAGGSEVRRVRDEIGARYVLDGSVRRLGHQVRVTTRLVDAGSEQQLWSETYDRDGSASTALAILDDVTDRIVGTVADVHGVLLRSMSQGLRDRAIETLDADEVLLRFWSYDRHPEVGEHARLRSRLEQLVTEQPQLADAWAALANLYCQEVAHGYNALDDPLGRAHRAVTRALDLDAVHHHAWHTLALTRYFAGDRDGFVHAAERALALNSRNTNTTAFLAFLFSQLGEPDRACQMTERAMAMNPAYPGWFHFVFFDRHYMRGEYAEALAAARRINMPQHMWSHWAVAVSAGQLGRAADAAAALDALFSLAPAVADENVLAAIDARWRWNQPESLARNMDGFRKAVALRDELRRTPSGAVTARPSSSSTTSPPSTVGSHASIAVLPFADLSPEKNQDWFCDGIAEEILNALTQLPGLHVAARTSAFSFRSQSDDLRSIGEKLGVATVLQGSVRRAGDRVRVTVQLVDVSNGFQLWSDRFDRELRDIFDIQDDIARAVAGRLKVTLSSDPGQRLVAPVTANLEAYELLLRGRLLLTRRGRAILDALPCFERAVALDPNLAEAHALLGDAHRLLGLYGIASATEMMPRARAAAERALALDPTQVEALATLANIAAIHDWDLTAARAYSDRALASDPLHVRALAERAIVLTIVDAPSTELEQHVLESVSRARTIDPLNAWAWAVESYCLALTNRPVEAVANALRAVALDALNFSARWILVWTLTAAGRFDEAVAAAEPALAMSGRNPRILTELAAICAARGDRAGAQAIHDELRTRAASSFIGRAELAAVAASAGHLDEARELAVQAIAARDTYLVFWKLPAWAPFRSDPDAMALIRQAGITQLNRRAGQ